MSRYELVINGKRYTVDVLDLSGASASVEVNGVAYQVELPGGAPVPVATSVAPPAAPRPASAPSAPARAPTVAAVPSAAAPAGPGTVLAPMPGVVLRIDVTVGDAVTAGQNLLVMEAMKMENEIKAAAAGTVQEVRVNVRQDVNVGDVLVVIG